MLVHSDPIKLIEYDEIVRLAELNSNDTVLDIGCGSGIQDLLLAQVCGHVMGIDFSNRAIDAAKDFAHASKLSSKVSFVEGDVLDANFQKSGFSRILSFCVLEHIPEWREVLKKAHEWLAPGGYLVISVDSLAPIKDEEIIKRHKEDSSVVTYFDNQTLASGLQDAGFSCLELHPILRSGYAKDIFVQSITRGSRGGFNVLRLLGIYIRLREAEREAGNPEEGMFLVAKAQPK